MSARLPRQVAVSIDLDGIPCYYKIHGLGAAPAALEHAILARALPRAAALFARRNMRATFFVVGRDVDVHRADRSGSGQSPALAALAGSPATVANAAALGELAAAGHELGNHSYAHPYELARLSATQIADEIGHCDRVLRAITGAPVRGFRAPGYDVSPAMLDCLATLGYAYDSSVFPAPGYYAAKAAVMGALLLLRRPSGAVMTNPRALLAPTEPYRPAMTSPWSRGQAPLVEIPVAVTPRLRVPAIGTNLLVMPKVLRERVLDGMRAVDTFNFELHGIDFADAEKDGIPGELVARQPDLRLPVEEKLARLEAILDALAVDRDVVTLGEIATVVQRER